MGCQYRRTSIDRRLDAHSLQSHGPAQHRRVQVGPHQRVEVMERGQPLRSKFEAGTLGDPLPVRARIERTGVVVMAMSPVVLFEHLIRHAGCGHKSGVRVRVRQFAEHLAEVEDDCLGRRRGGSRGVVRSHLTIMPVGDSTCGSRKEQTGPKRRRIGRVP